MINLQCRYDTIDFQDELGLDWLDYGARMYDAVLGRTSTQDPLAEKFYGLSPYCMFANNPLRFVDPTGMEIEEASKKEWERQKGNVESQRNKLQSKSDGLAAKAEKKGWGTEKLARKQGNLGERISSLNSSLKTMGNLEISSQVYRLSTPETGENSGVSLDADKVINISFRSTASFVHETIHAGQFETGDLAFDLITGGTLAQDVTDEVAAFKAQFAYSPSSVSSKSSTSVANSFNSITPSWVQGLSGGTLYVPGGIANTGVSPLNINSTRADFIKAYPNNAAMKTLPASFILKHEPTVYYKK
jgi:RHS repeat-associated protein